jgi:hypothetical protein
MNLSVPNNNNGEFNREVFPFPSVYAQNMKWK